MLILNKRKSIYYIILYEIFLNAKRIISYREMYFSAYFSDQNVWEAKEGSLHWEVSLDGVCCLSDDAKRCTSFEKHLLPCSWVFVKTC